MKKILLLMLCNLFIVCILNAQTVEDELSYGLSVDVSVNADTQDAISDCTPSGFLGSKTRVSTYVYNGYVAPPTSGGADRYEWYTEPGTGWTITDRNLGAPMQYVQITGSSASTESILLVRAHNSCGWSSYQVVNSIPMIAPSLNSKTGMPDVEIVKEDAINGNQPEYEENAIAISDDCTPAGFSGSKTRVSSTVYNGYVSPPTSGGADRYEWYTDPGTGWTITDRNLGAPMQYVQITAPSSSASTILFVRAHNSCGWSYSQIVGSVGP
jgi:predicted small secreted protein